MGSLTNFLEAELLDHIFNAAYTPPATIYLALATADPTDAATGASMNEAADANAYARTAIVFGAAAARVITQSADVDFPTASGGGWGAITHWAVVDNSTHGAGNVLAHGALNATKTVNDGDSPTVAASEVTVTGSAAEMSNYLANILLDFAFRNQAFSAPATYIALCDAVVGDGDTGTTISEPAGGAYARKQVNINGGGSPTWDLAVSGDPSYVDNTHAITFVTATASWGTITSWAICDALTVGNLLFYDNDVTDKAVGDGDTAEFAIGDLDCQIS